MMLQVPQLSASYKLLLSEPVNLKPLSAKRTRALLIGINYVGHAQVTEEVTLSANVCLV